MTTTDSGPAIKADTPAEQRGTSRWFWRYWFGGSVSSLGDAVTLVALPLTAIVVAHASSLEVGLLAACQIVGWIVIGLPAGVLVERLPLRGTQIVIDLLRGTLLLSIPVVWWTTGRVGIGQLMAVSLANGFASVIFDVGNSTMMPFLVSKEELTKRNSLMSGTNSATQLAGPSLGGTLVQLLGGAGALVVDTASFFISAFVISTVPRPPARERTVGEQRTSVRASIRIGWNHVVRHPILRPAMLDAAAINFVCGALTALIPIFLVRTLALRPLVVGLLFAAEGAGSLVGAALTPKLSARIGSARCALLADLALPATVALMPLAHPGMGALVFAAGNAAFAMTVVISSIVFRTHRHTETPRDLLPRVMATVRFASWGMFPFGAAAAGAVATLESPRSALWWTVAVAVIPLLILLASPIRSRRDLEG